MTLTENKLPKSWRWVRLDEVGKFDSGGTPAKEKPEYWNGDIPFVTGADITKLYISRENARAFLTQKGLQSGKTAICKPGSILFVTELVCASQDLSPFTCGEQIMSEFAARYITSITPLLIENCRGATIQGLTRDFIHQIKIPLPPVSEQKRISQILNEQMAAVEKARAAAETELETINSLPAVILRQAFSGDL